MKPNTLRTYRNENSLLVAYRNGDRPKVLMTYHFYARFAAMKAQANLTADEVTNAICSPERIGFTASYDAMLLQHGRVTVSVVLDADGYPTAATLLWRTAEDWLESYGKRPVDGREARADLSHLNHRTTTTRRNA
jgi:hypothetical protein